MCWLTAPHLRKSLTVETVLGRNAERRERRRKDPPPRFVAGASEWFFEAVRKWRERNPDWQDDFKPEKRERRMGRWRMRR